MGNNMVKEKKRLPRVESMMENTSMGCNMVKELESI